ncbi:MAG: TlpA disulfide reductase family protein [Isosphaeraceae bacterium]
MLPSWIAPSLAAAILGLGLNAPALALPQADERAKPGAEPASGAFATIDELDASYTRQLTELHRRRIADLTKLAAKLHGLDADRAYGEILRAAINNDMFVEAELAAKQFLATEPTDQRDRALAFLTMLVAKAERGEHDQSLNDLLTFLKANPKRPEADQRIETDTALAVGEAYLQRLVRAGRYDIARKVCELAIEHSPNPAVQEHFRTRLARLAMVGKPAPPIRATDIEGKPFDLASLKGQVVLVEFWATWCPPCISELPALMDLKSKYGHQGFVILGVNADSEREGGEPLARTLPVVRRFLLDHRISWPNVLCGDGAEDLTKAYGVKAIPASFLIGRDGTIQHLELTGEALDQAVAKAVAAPKPGQ